MDICILFSVFLQKQINDILIQMQKNERKTYFFLIPLLKCILSSEKQYVSSSSWVMQKIFWWFISINGENSLESHFLVCITDNSYNQNWEIPLCHWVESENYFHPHLSSLVNIVQKSYSEFGDTHNFKVTIRHQLLFLVHTLLLFLS